MYGHPIDPPSLSHESPQQYSHQASNLSNQQKLIPPHSHLTSIVGVQYHCRKFTDSIECNGHTPASLYNDFLALNAPLSAIIDLNVPETASSTAPSILAPSATLSDTLNHHLLMKMMMKLVLLQPLTIILMTLFTNECMH